jgi:hypothetical protein
LYLHCGESGISCTLPFLFIFTPAHEILWHFYLSFLNLYILLFCLFYTLKAFKFWCL